MVIADGADRGDAVIRYTLRRLAFAGFLVWYARRPRRDPKTPAGPTWEDRQREDLAAEQERMRALEDAIYGPPDG